MYTLRKMCIITFYLFFIPNIQSHSQEHSRTMTIDFGKEYQIKVDTQKSNDRLLDLLIKVGIPSIIFIGSVYSLWTQIEARRRDDDLKNQLERVNKQISEFYGPLFTLYESGDQNFYIFLKHFGKDFSFSNPDFENWSNSVFQPTNISMESIIINKADLILGKEVPACLLSFCAWSATMKVYVKAHRKGNYNMIKWQQIFDDIKHPESNMQVYLRASFEVLKEEQSRLLAGSRDYVDERKLINTINERTSIYQKSLEQEPLLDGKTRKQRWEEAT